MKEVPPPAGAVAPEQDGQRKPSTEAERHTVRQLKEIAAVLKTIYEDSEVVAEVNAAIGSGYYRDERVLLADLLEPEKSLLYAEVRTRNIESGGTGGGRVRWGLFAKRFRQAAPKAATGSGVAALLRKKISIYHPYSGNFSVASGFSEASRPLLVPATVEADWIEVNDPHCPYPHEHGGNDCRRIRVDDDYAETHPVHILTVGAEPAGTSFSGTANGSRLEEMSAAGPQREELADAQPVTLVYLGEVKCTRQYDRLISFTGNGGGSELKFIRGDAYVSLNNNQQVTDTEFDVISVDFKRKDIRKERSKRVYAIWDPDWEPEKLEQVFGIYEEDTQGEREFEGSVKTRVKHPGGETEIVPVSYSFSVRTQDALIRQINWDRSSFFLYNRRGLGGCGLRGGWTWYDCRLSVSYSLPVR